MIVPYPHGYSIIPQRFPWNPAQIHIGGLAAVNLAGAVYNILTGVVFRRQQFVSALHDIPAFRPQFPSHGNIAADALRLPDMVNPNIDYIKHICPPSRKRVYVFIITRRPILFHVIFYPPLPD